MFVNHLPYRLAVPRMHLITTLRPALPPREKARATEGPWSASCADSLEGEGARQPPPPAEGRKEVPAPGPVILQHRSCPGIQGVSCTLSGPSPYDPGIAPRTRASAKGALDRPSLGNLAVPQTPPWATACPARPTQAPAGHQPGPGGPAWAVATDELHLGERWWVHPCLRAPGAKARPS